MFDFLLLTNFGSFKRGLISVRPKCFHRKTSEPLYLKKQKTAPKTRCLKSAFSKQSCRLVLTRAFLLLPTFHRAAKISRVTVIRRESPRALSRRRMLCPDYSLPKYFHYKLFVRVCQRYSRRKRIFNALFLCADLFRCAPIYTRCARARYSAGYTSFLLCRHTTCRTKT